MKKYREMTIYWAEQPIAEDGWAVKSVDFEDEVNDVLVQLPTGREFSLGEAIAQAIYDLDADAKADEFACDGQLSAHWVAKQSYPFATDSEHGTIEAIDFVTACSELDALVPESTIQDGGWGWIEDTTNGERYTIGTSRG